jgi:hypothetical protein
VGSIVSFDEVHHTSSVYKLLMMGAIKLIEIQDFPGHSDDSRARVLQLGSVRCSHHLAGFACGKRVRKQL